MGQSIVFWENYFSTLSLPVLTKVIDSLETLRRAETIWEEYWWTGLPSLLQIAKAMRSKREEAEALVACGEIGRKGEANE